MLQEIHLISNRALMLGALLLLGSGILLGFSPELAHRWFAFLLALEPETMRPLAGRDAVAWRALALIVGLYAAGATPLLVSRAWNILARTRDSGLPGPIGIGPSRGFPGNGG